MGVAASVAGTMLYFFSSFTIVEINIRPSLNSHHWLSPQSSSARDQTISLVKLC
jgi:hypothetical protein